MGGWLLTEVASPSEDGQVTITVQTGLGVE